MPATELTPDSAAVLNWTIQSYRLAWPVVDAASPADEASGILGGAGGRAGVLRSSDAGRRFETTWEK